MSCFPIVKKGDHVLVEIVCDDCGQSIGKVTLLREDFDNEKRAAGGDSCGRCKNPPMVSDEEDEE